MARRKQPRPTKREQKKTKKAVLVGAAITVAIAAVFALLVYFGIMFFQLKKIEVVGNHYCSAEEIRNWIRMDKYSENSLYVYWKFNRKGIECPPTVQSIKVRLKSPEEVQVTVHEKTFAGYVDYHDTHLYFDAAGIASLATTEAVDGAIYIEGMELQEDQLRLGGKIITTVEGLTDNVCELLGMLKEYALAPDKITCNADLLTLHFGGIRAQVGNGNFADKLAQIQPILDKAAELYPNISGVLHLENYNASDQSVRFEPDKENTG